jgi:hypothetical protein
MGAMRRGAIPVLGLAVGALAGAGTAVASTDAAPQAVATTRGCSWLTVPDVSRVARISVKRQDLAPPDKQIRCSTAFYGGVGDVIAVIAVRFGNDATLRRLRSVQSGQAGATVVRPVTGFGTGAFVVRQRYLAFRVGIRVVSLETSYSTTTGQLILTVAQLEQLARTVSQRIQHAS